MLKSEQNNMYAYHEIPHAKFQAPPSLTSVLQFDNGNRESAARYSCVP